MLYHFCTVTPFAKRCVHRRLQSEHPSAAGYDRLLDDAIVPLARAELSSTLSTPERLPGGGWQRYLLQRESAFRYPTPASRKVAAPTETWQQYLAEI